MAGQKIGTMKVLCGLGANVQVNLDSYNGRAVRGGFGEIIGKMANARIEKNCVVVDVLSLPPTGKEGNR